MLSVQWSKFSVDLLCVLLRIVYVALIVVLDIYSLYIKLFNLHYFSFLDHNLFAFMQLLLSLFGAHYTVYTYHCAMFIGYFSVLSAQCAPCISTHCIIHSPHHHQCIHHTSILWAAAAQFHDPENCCEALLGRWERKQFVARNGQILVIQFQGVAARCLWLCVWIPLYYFRAQTRESFRKPNMHRNYSTLLPPFPLFVDSRRKIIFYTVS